MTRALAALAPKRPTRQQQVDAVLKQQSNFALTSEDRSETDVKTDVETCRLLRLPVAWFQCCAAAANSPAACKALLEQRAALRCVERFALDTHQPQLDWVLYSRKVQRHYLSVFEEWGLKRETYYWTKFEKSRRTKRSRVRLKSSSNRVTETRVASPREARLRRSAERSRRS